MYFLQAVRQALARVLSKVRAGAFALLPKLIGQWNWQPPAWVQWIASQFARLWRFFTTDIRRVVMAAAVLAAFIGGWYWYKTRPLPLYTTYTVTAPELTEYNEKGISSIKPLLIAFSESVAPLKSLDKPVMRPIDLSPHVAGSWSWTTDRMLQFTPKSDWPVDQDFHVRFDRKGLFAPGVEVEEYGFDFHSQPFSATFSDSRFYQDPRDPNLKQLVATVRFSHPVDTEQLERRVSLVLAKDAAYLGLKPDSRNFTLTYDKFRLQAFIHSVALATPRDDTPITVLIKKGVRAARGGNELAEPLHAEVVIPGRSSLRFSRPVVTLVDNSRYEPEQVLLLNSSSPVTEKAFAGKLSALLLPLRHPKQAKNDNTAYNWSDPTQIGSEILAQSPAVNLTYISLDSAEGTAHGFKFSAPVGRYLYVLLRDGVEGSGGYLSAHPAISTIQVQPYPQLLKFLGEGALLSLSGDRKVGFISRDVSHVQIEIGRILPNQLQHIAPRMYDFHKPQTEPYFNDTISERFVTARDYTGKKAGKPAYDSIDLSQYLQGKAAGTRGLFLLRIRSFEPKPKGSQEAQAGSDDESGNEDYNYQGPGIEDSRLILVTDLGIIVKRAKDGWRDVFVQSIRTGLPAEGVRVQAIGRNGQPALAAVTDAGGRARLPNFADLKREKRPILILAEKDADYSFLPFESRGRTLNISRFNTGGIENAESGDELSAYLFSDRGVYRPGETAHIGLIARTADWKSSLAGLPVEVEITDSRAAVVSRSLLKLSSTAFDEVAFTSQLAAPTGMYQASAYLAKDESKKELLGSTSFKVQEFEPDRMKVRLDLSAKPLEGWMRPADVQVHATVDQLFGAPAANRRVEGEINLTAFLPRFDRYPDYRFQIGEFLDEPFQEDLKPAVTDDKGNADLPIDLTRFTGRAYRLNVLVRAYEAQGGRNVAAQNSAIVSDATYLVGVKSDGPLNFVKRGSARQARWLAVNQQLAAIAAADLRLEWVQRKYVSVLTQQADSTYKYVSRLRETIRDTKKVNINAGGTNFPLPAQEPGEFVLVLRDAGGAELNRLEYSVAGEANLSRSLDRDAELQIQLDKPGYGGGDTIAVSIRAPYTGSGLITIERDRVYQSQWFKTSTTSSVQKIQVPRDFEGGGYVSVEFVRDPSSSEIFLSPLSYGVAPFSANLAQRTQPLKLTAPREIKPGANLSIRLAVGAPSRVAVLAVDEGILQVARDHNPDPLAFFFQKRMLEIETSQILDLILPDFQKFLAMAAPGGDADAGFSRHLNPFAKKRKAPVAYWSGLVDLGIGEHEFRYTVPDYFNGKLRIVAIAVNAQKAGVAQTETEVKGPFILTPNVPAMVAPNDEVLVTVGVFNNTVGGTGPIHLDAQVSGGLTPIGPASVDLSVADKKEGVGAFRFKANPLLGPASLKFTARRGATESRMEESIGVRPPIAYRPLLTLGRFDGSSTLVPLTRDMYAEHRKAQAAVSSVPLVWGQGLIAWLDAYPYTCTEQLISKGMAAVIFASRPEFGTVRSPDKSPLAETIAMLQSRQNDQGGFGLWTSSPETAEFATIYAAQFLIEARERGQAIPAATLDSLNGWLARYASTPASTLADGRFRAYAVYLLARQGIKPGNALSNVEAELSNRYPQSWPKDLAAGWLAATYRLMQRNNDAEKIIAKIPFARSKTDFGEEIYYDPVVHDAQLLYLLAKYFPARLKSVPGTVLEDLGHAVNAGRMDSLSVAWTLLALDSYAKAATANTKFAIDVVGKDGRDRALQVTPGSMPKADLPMDAAKVQFKKDGALPAYYSVEESGFDRNPPSVAQSRGIEVIRDYLDANGKPVTQVNVGQEFLVRLRLRATSRNSVPQIAVVELLPGGTEPVLEVQSPSDSTTPNADPAATPGQTTAVSALPVGVPEKSDWAPQHIDVRDDRLVLYGDASHDAGTFVYRVRATNAGVFQTPPAFVEGMYDRSVTGISLPGKIQIVQP